MEKLTEKEKDILLNLLLQEQNHIHNQNGNIKYLLQDYRNDLHKIYLKIVDTLED
ncbi:hypothetical protein [Methanobrevibacter sp.]|uniref:hypothetical protein n=1 Tax=Methanobrevibacter sp. TaxID=66852 RepID=UPI00388F73BD